MDLYSALSWTHLLSRSGIARVLKGSHSFTCTPRVHPLTEWTIPAFAFPAEARTHLGLPNYRPRKDGRLSWPWVAGWLNTEISVRHLELNVAHLSTNRARRRLTSLIKANAPTNLAKLLNVIAISQPDICILSLLTYLFALQREYHKICLAPIHFWAITDIQTTIYYALQCATAVTHIKSLTLTLCSLYANYTVSCISSACRAIEQPTHFPVQAGSAGGYPATSNLISSSLSTVTYISGQIFPKIRSVVLRKVADRQTDRQTIAQALHNLRGGGKKCYCYMLSNIHSEP